MVHQWVLQYWVPTILVTWALLKPISCQVSIFKPEIKCILEILIWVSFWSNSRSWTNSWRTKTSLKSNENISGFNKFKDSNKLINKWSCNSSSINSCSSSSNCIPKLILRCNSRCGSRLCSRAYGQASQASLYSSIFMIRTNSNISKVCIALPASSNTSSIKVRISPLINISNINRYRIIFKVAMCHWLSRHTTSSSHCNSHSKDWQHSSMSKPLEMGRGFQRRRERIVITHSCCSSHRMIARALGCRSIAKRAGPWLTRQVKGTRALPPLSHLAPTCIRARTSPLPTEINWNSARLSGKMLQQASNQTSTKLRQTWTPAETEASSLFKL